MEGEGRKQAEGERMDGAGGPREQRRLGAGPLAPFPSTYCRFTHVVRPSVQVMFEPSERRGHRPGR